ncbi:uncharacterized protein LOC133181132 [Saccostrea echinata]|uniref:uncharacterized protein LOC133181132 n=1 Tax=Saccostrea echinata TaxID=191078 RepID=UPI002A7F4BAA|nr:uncharacterized protein LOC133181132 [Saccostrea echinata]
MPILKLNVNNMFKGHFHFFSGSLAHKYFTLNNNVPGTIFIGTQEDLLINANAKLSKLQGPTSPTLRQLQQDQLSFDMELCDIITISKGSFNVAGESIPKSGVLFQCFKRPENSANLIEILTIMTTNTIYEQLYKNKVSMST